MNNNIIKSITIADNETFLRQISTPVNIESDKNLSISINNSYLENLKPDEYSIEIKLNNGKALSTKFLISNKNSDDMENNINKDDVVDKTNKFNFKWLYSLFIIPIVMVIIFLKRKLEK